MDLLNLHYLRCSIRMHGVATNEANLQKHLTALNAKLDAYEVILGKSKYLGGDVSALPLLGEGAYTDSISLSMT